MLAANQRKKEVCLVVKCQQNVIEFVTIPGQLFLLTVIFSRGEPLPVHYLEPGQIGSNFVDFVLEVIEKPVQKRSHDLSDVFIGMMLSYNLQFQDNTSNVFIDRQVQVVYIESSVTMDIKNFRVLLLWLSRT